MRGTVLYGPRDVRFEDREAPRIQRPTDAILRIEVACVCGSDLWPYRGIQKVAQPTPMGHEYCGTVEEASRSTRRQDKWRPLSHRLSEGRSRANPQGRAAVSTTAVVILVRPDRVLPLPDS
jgi:threonine dehydrogenase-like Zn-dependent dehydrogenase